MKPVFQTIFDSDGGNCLTASVASILELPITDVPNFAAETGDGWETALNDWLHSRNLKLVEIGFADISTFRGTYFANHGACCILSGPSTFPNRAHAVVGQVNEHGGIDVVHDPIAGGSGPVDGYRWVRFIVKE